MDIPSGWKSFHLKDVTYESRVIAASKNATHLIVFGVNNQTGLSTDSKYHADNLDRYKVVKPGMFAYNPMRLNIGSIGYCEDALGEGLVSPDYVVFGCKENKLDSKYLSYCIQEHHWKNWVRRAGAGSVRVRIYYKDISIYPIILPPLPEQCKIADILSTWDKAIAKTEQLIAALQRRKKGLMQRLLTGEVRFAGFDGEWESKSLNNFGKCIRGVSYNPKTDLYPKDTAQSVRLLRANNISDGRVNIYDLQYVDESKIKETQYLRGGDIAVCIASGSQDLVGKTAQFDSKDTYKYTVGAFCAIYRAKRNAVQRFVAQLLQSSEYRKKLHAITAGTNIRNLRPSDFENIKFLVPPTEMEMNKVSELFETCDAEIDLHMSKLVALKRHKKGLMQRLLTGQVRVKV